MRGFVFHVRALFRNIGFMWNIRDRFTCGMFRMFRMFRLFGGSRRISCPGVFKAHPPIAPRGAIPYPKLPGLDAIGLQHIREAACAERFPAQ
jgi:hypothetical protein